MEFNWRRKRGVWLMLTSCGLFSFLVPFTLVLRPRVNLAAACRHCDNMQRRERLVAAQRACAPALQEAWPAAASHHQDGAGRHELP